jgi:hypothetical protein
VEIIILLIKIFQEHAKEHQPHVDLKQFMAQINVLDHVEVIYMKWENIVILIVLVIIEKKLIHQLNNAHVDFYILKVAII